MVVMVVVVVVVRACMRACMPTCWPFARCRCVGQWRRCARHRRAPGAAIVAGRDDVRRGTARTATACRVSADAGAPSRSRWSWRQTELERGGMAWLPRRWPPPRAPMRGTPPKTVRESSAAVRTQTARSRRAAAVTPRRPPAQRHGRRGARRAVAGPRQGPPAHLRRPRDAHAAPPGIPGRPAALADAPGLLDRASRSVACDPPASRPARAAAQPDACARAAAQALRGTASS